MKVLATATNVSAKVEQPAEMVMETISTVMRAIRREMRKHCPVEISMQQFRALGILKRHPGATLSLVTEHLGLTMATASKLVDALVKSELVTRIDAPEDRRKVVLNITEVGERTLEDARRAALGRLGEILAALDETDRAAVIRAMEVLGHAFDDMRSCEVDGKVGVA